MSKKGHFLSSKCLQEPLLLGLQQQLHTLTAGHLSSHTATTGCRAGPWRRVVLPLVPVSADEGQMGSEKQWDLCKDMWQVSVRLRVCWTSRHVTFALHPVAGGGPGLSSGWRYMKQRQQLLSSATSQPPSHPELLLPPCSSSTPL